MNKILMTMVLIGALCLMGVGSALAITFSTPAGAKDSAGDPVSATAEFTLVGGDVVIILTNNLVDQKDVGQNISDLFFILVGHDNGSLLSSSGLERTVFPNGTSNTTGTYQDGSVVGTGWVLTSGTVYHLDGLNSAADTPAHTIIGAPGTGNKYNNANNSITGSTHAAQPHNPFLAGHVTFTLDFGPALNTLPDVTNVAFSFGTTPGDNVAVPLPPSVLLLGSGLLGLGLLCFRRKIKG